MPTNNQNKLQQLAVGDADAPSTSRAGGAASRGSTKIAPDKGSAFAAMESTLKAGLEPSAKALSGSKLPSRQFGTSAAGGNVRGAVQSPKAFGQKIDPTAKKMDSTMPEGKAKGSIRRFRQIKMA